MKRILVVDDHQIIREGLKDLLSEIQEFGVAGEAGSGIDAIRMVRESDWDVVLLDISMRDISGIDALKQIKRWKPELPVLFLSVHTEENYALALLRAGASGYLNKSCTPDELVDAIRMVLSGRRYVTSSLRDQMVSGLIGEEQNAPHTKLGQREFQIFCKLANGQGISQIAKDLSVTAQTVCTHRVRILAKMGMKTNADVTYYAIKHGLIQ